MVKLMIVDDEQVVREGLVAILGRGFPELDLEIWQARNGQMALEMARLHQPELILMDIKMPGMDGLEATEEISKEHPAIKFIMVSAYDTFDYARKAIRLGVKDYLLKPSKASEIIATVGAVLAQIEEEQLLHSVNQREREALQKVLPVVETDIVTQLLFDHVHEVHSNELMALLGVTTADAMFTLNVLLPPASEGLYPLVKSRIRSMGSGWVGALFGRQIAVIVFREQGKTYRSQAIATVQELLGLAGRANPQGGWFVGIGGECRSLDYIRQSYQEAMLASMDHTLPGRYRFYEDMPTLGVIPAGYSAIQWERTIAERIRLGEWEQIQEMVLEMLRRYESEGASLLQTQQRILELVWIASRGIMEMGIEIETPLYSFQAQDYRQLRSEARALLEAMERTCAGHLERMNPDTVQQLRQFIVEHSHEDITLESMGQMVGLSPFYISKMFKEQLGINYIDFLTECRIEHAKRMMSDPGKSLKEITFEIGYHDPNYFSKVFKKMCGKSPTEYRKQLLGGRG
ncbi:response regulator [Paenibacillus sp. NPDC057934]|uniref:response regulator n=1 Tax=Paenibacillus sp. NPDC057934 TaxID=3346282 RepID=UPI0036DE0203